MLKTVFIQQQLQWYVRLDVFSVVSVHGLITTCFILKLSLPFPCVFSRHV